MVGAGSFWGDADERGVAGEAGACGGGGDFGAADQVHGSGASEALCADSACPAAASAGGLGLLGGGFHQARADGAGRENEVGGMAAKLPAPHSGLDALGDVAGCGEDGVFPRALVAADGEQNLCACGAPSGGGEVLGVIKNALAFGSGRWVGLLKLRQVFCRWGVYLRAFGFGLPCRFGFECVDAFLHFACGLAGVRFKVFEK